MLVARQVSDRNGGKPLLALRSQGTEYDVADPFQEHRPVPPDTCELRLSFVAATETT